MSETFNTDNRGANIGNFANNMQDSASMQANVYSTEQKQNLTEAATEIQQLLEQLSKSYPANTTPGRMTVATEAIKRIESNPTLMQKILSALKAGSLQAFEQALNHPAASFVIGAMEDWQNNNEKNK